MNLVQLKTSQLKLWEKNPRGIKESDFSRLKTEIEELKVFKPLIVTQEGDEYVVLGGNMRLRAYRDLGIDDVWVSIVDAPDDGTKTRYALADNDRAGYYEQEKLAELSLHLDPLDLELYHIDVGSPKPLKEILEKYGPEDAEEDSTQVNLTKFSVVIKCANDEDMDRTHKDLLDQGYPAETRSS